MTMHPVPRPTIPAAAALQLDHLCARGPLLLLRLAQNEVLQQDRDGRRGIWHGTRADSVGVGVGVDGAARRVPRDTEDWTTGRVVFIDPGAHVSCGADTIAAPVRTSPRCTPRPPASPNGWRKAARRAASDDEAAEAGRQALEEMLT